MTEHLLFESVTGYELFSLREYEGLSGGSSYSDYLVLTQTVSHLSSLPFENPAEALGHIQQRPECLEVLKNFLAMNNVKTLHCDDALKHVVQTQGIVWRSSPNVSRGIRLNMSKILKSTPQLAKLRQMVVGTAHAFSRDAVKYDMEREDNVAITVAAELDSLEDEIRALSYQISKMIDRIIPSFYKTSNDKLELILGSKSEDNSSIESIIRDEVINRVDKKDVDNLKEIKELAEKKKALYTELEAYLAVKMKSIAPNLRCILGDRLSCKLLRHSGGLVNLSIHPASTLQLLGAEKALFKSLHTRRPTPKHGILYEIASNPRLTRFVANKCSIAARIDAFEMSRESAYGEELKRLINKRVGSLKSGKSKRAVDTTHSVLESVKKKLQEKSLKRLRPKTPKDKVQDAEEDVKRPKTVKKAYYEPTKASTQRSVKKDNKK